MGRETIELSELIRAAEDGDARGVESLLASGADVNARTQGGETALMRAAARGHAEVISLLLERGAEPDARRRDQWTALMLAAFFGRAEAARALLGGGADVTAADRNGSTALGWAVSRGHVEAARLLKEAESDAERQRRARAAGLTAAAPARPQTDPRTSTRDNDPAPNFNPTEPASQRSAGGDALRSPVEEAALHARAGADDVGREAIVSTEASAAGAAEAPTGAVVASTGTHIAPAASAGRASGVLSRAALYAAPLLLVLCGALIYKIAFVPAGQNGAQTVAPQGPAAQTGQQAQPVSPIQQALPAEQTATPALPTPDLQTTLPAQPLASDAQPFPATLPATGRAAPFYPNVQPPPARDVSPTSGEPSVVQLGQSEPGQTADKASDRKSAQDSAGSTPRRAETPAARPTQQDSTQPAAPTATQQTNARPAAPPDASPTPKRKVIPWP
jgi:hypothetical protein